jgi:hypothetical protein
MSYDLAVWEGGRPSDNEAAAKFYVERVVPQIEEYDLSNPVPPTPRIRAYVEALLTRWPDIQVVGDDVLNEDSPWSVSPLMADATGVERRKEFSSISLSTALTVAMREAAGTVWSAAAPCRSLSRAAVTCNRGSRRRRARLLGAGPGGCCPPGLRGPGPGARLQHQTPLPRRDGRAAAWRDGR